MPVAIPGLVVVLDAFLLALVSYALLRLVAVWLRPVLHIVASGAQTKAKQNKWLGYLKTALTYGTVFGLTFKGLKWLGQEISVAVRWTERYVATAISRYVGASLLPAARWLHGMAVLVHGLADWALGLSQETYRALYHLRHVAMPRYVRSAIAPVKAALAKAEAELDAFERVVTDARLAVDQALKGIGKDVVGSFDDVMGAFAAGFADLWTDFYETVWTGFNDLIGKTIPGLLDNVEGISSDLYETADDSLDYLRSRLREVEDTLANKASKLTELLLAALGTAAGIAGLEAILIKVAPNLFCRNTKGIAKKLCGIDESLIDELLALSLAFLVVIDPVVIAKAALVAENAAEPVIRKVAA